MKDVDKKELNEVVHLSKQILKILYIVFIIAGIYVTTIILKEWKVWSFLAEILKIIAPLFIGLIVAWLFNPFVNKLKKKGIKRGLGAALAYTLFIGVIVLVISLVIPMLTDQINDLVTSIPSIIDTVRGWIDGIFAKIASNEHFDSGAFKNTIFEKIEIYGSGLAESLPSASINVIKALASGITTFVVGLIIGFFLLVSFDNGSNLLAFLPPRIKKSTNELIESINGSLRKFVKGTITLSSLVFLVSSLGFWISGLKSPLLFGLFCGITNVIPYVGPYIGGAPAVIVGFFYHRIGAVQQRNLGRQIGAGVAVDNFLRIQLVVVGIERGYIVEQLFLKLRSHGIHPFRTVCFSLCFISFCPIIEDTGNPRQGLF